MQYRRDIKDKITQLARSFPAIVMTGARQTGKTTLLKEIFSKHAYVSLDLPADAQLAEEDPKEFLKRYPAPVVIDEVQYAPRLFRNLKIVIDRNRDLCGQFILTGSQKFTLMKEVSDSLAGRCAILELETLSVKELGDDFMQMIRKFPPAFALARGGFPQLWKDKNIPSTDFFRSYLATYIERDVRQILNISSLRDFDRFMRACAVRSGQMLNKSEIAKDVGISPKTANDWLSVLEASNQICLLEPYFANIGKRLVKSPKLYFNDTGLLTFLLGLTMETLSDSYLVGSIWETYVFSELRKYLIVHHPEAQIWFFRDQGYEVDFLIVYKGKVFLSECKWTELPSKRDFASCDTVKTFLKQVTSKTFVISRAEKRFPVTSVNEAINGFELSDWIESL